MALFANERAGKATVIEGTGRFVGEPSTGSLPPGGETADGDVTVNLVDVPVAQAAKTILSDILNVRYTIEPGIKGKMTIQTPKPVTREAALDLFQAALRANGAAIVGSNGQYRVVPADQAAVGAVMRVDGMREGGDESLAGRIGSNVRVVQVHSPSSESGIAS